MSKGIRVRRALDALLPRTRQRIARALAPEEIALAGVPPLSDADAARLRPTFVLSTGRAGTLWLAELLKQTDGIWANHAQQPELVRQSRLAFEGTTSRECQREIVRAARDDMLSAAQGLGLAYVETNNRMTFLAPAAAAAYPGARFVHVVRDPVRFVASGLSRGWYQGHPADVGRVRLPDTAAWSMLSPVEKIAWLWQTTNSFVEEFRSELDPARSYFARAEDLFQDPDSVVALCQFLEVAPPEREVVARHQARPLNRRVASSHPAREALTSEDAARVLELCPLATRYGYAS